ncbi:MULTISPECIES: FAD-binding and (Fe-S)-binding domain-containing protein [Streptomyces]|uniref:D-2-hydroxyglutarate dehydrogenase n=2 Tax=Streptomyces TaxID=1883 RepID=Q9F2Y0_STRCO|nr:MULTISPECIES: FAD-binding and (Fe-S)-binding domain-containing protein [Streptomyces]WOY98995.1 FAD-binding and (Fe-S)-binding domain-containing protein [Streptomyces violaceoruber]WTE19415.1 FAD-binding oxidoreductase [Streptomyces anthocyanicus]MDX2927891.1 FAD-binding and (Fe-S)-binding domain-containing protein [Streptomyces sp. NRRL_B-16638]MDX3368750.1 FAD-binding and (Fe-S)-binding domain-containing protein [Streptomyces sp. ME02-6987-2C]MDX3403958.1 FAD-binding and (Fe-S)-binding do
MTDLEAALRRAVRGEVGFDTTSRALTTMDASNYRRVPLGVVAPRDADDVAAVLEVCRERGVPVVARGGGTSIAGQATGTGVVLDFTRHMNRLVGIDPEARTAVVQPGLVLDRLQDAAAPHGLRFGPDPSTHGRCTLGGMIGNNSCGSHSVAWGTTADSVRELSVLTARGRRLRLGREWSGAPEGLRELVDGELARLRTGFPDLPRRISGYALDALLPEKGADVARSFCGSEGTLGVLTEAVVRLVESPRARALAVLGYTDEAGAAEAAAGLLPLGPLTVEGMAVDLVPSTEGLPRGGAWLFVETGGDTEAEARARAEAVVRAADVVDALVVTDPAGQRTLWRIREDASGTATRMPDGSEAWPGWEDCAVPPARLGGYLRDFRRLLTAHELRGTPYGHFGDGCIHVRIDFDLLSEAGVARFRRFSEELADVVVAHGGSLSGEHGDGQARAELLPRMYGPETVALFERAKAVWDPDDLLNPGMLVRPAPLDANLRFSVLPREPVDVEFGYPSDGGDFSAAVRRCVGVAKCRTTSVSGAGVMCPSFRATGDEAHSTRGRARLLHEMLAGELVTDGWRSTEVRDALDLCLSCKGCRSDCPVEVDMATYKAEFLHHHYEGRRRPAAHYAMGWLPVWLRWAARARVVPVVNALASVRPLAAVAKRLGGIAGEREVPRLAGETFSRWWRGRRRGPAGTGDLVVLWPDTFTEHLSPSVGRAAVRVLEAAGLRVALPPTLRGRAVVGDGTSRSALALLTARRGGRVCCGLTYVSTGQLDRARAVMRRTLDLMAPVLETSAPVVVLEPSCAAALRTDLPELLHDDPRAARLAARVLTFAEALERHAPDWTPPQVNLPAVGQTHCHQHAVLGDAADRRLRESAGLTGELSGGCCGLAGNFGFEDGHYEVSAACAEDQLLPAVREAPDGAVVLADGFSCRTQLEQLAGVRGRHLAEVLAERLE